MLWVILQLSSFNILMELPHISLPPGWFQPKYLLSGCI